MTYWKCIGKKVLIGLFALSLIIAPSLIQPQKAIAESIAFYTWPSIPSGAIGIARPEIKLKMRFAGLTLTDYSMSINGKRVPVTYDLVKEAFTFTPASALAAGAHRVTLKVQFKGYASKTYQWNFSVKPGAISELPTFNSGQTTALKHINAIRKEAGLKAVKLNAKLNLIAAAHAKYQNLNGKITHVETIGKAGFVGATLAERVAYFGYSADATAEDISMQPNASSSTAVAISDLFHAPYHRIPFLDPDLTEIGYSQVEKFHVVLFGMEENRSNPFVVVSPVGTNVPASWKGNETPDPLRFHTMVTYPTGYPLVTGVYGNNIKQVVPISSSLVSSSGKQIALLINRSTNDTYLTNEVLYMPSSPLAAGTKYKAKVTMKAYMNDGSTKLFTKEWTFQTESAK